MAVLIEALNVIVKVSVLEKKYPGGVQAYTSDCPNKTFCTDGRLTRVGFMSPADVDSFLQRLELHGLQTTDSDGYPDVVVVDQHAAAPTAPCPWIAVGRFNDNVIGAWSIDPDDVPGELYAPRSWKFEGSLSENPGYVSSEEKAERFVFDGFDGRNDVFIDLETGKKVYVGRVIADKNPMPAPSPGTDEELNPVRASMVWAEAVNTLDPSFAADLLADDLEVSFQWSFDDIKGRDAYLEYWQDKFSQVDPDGPRTHAEFALTNAYTFPGSELRPCLVLHHENNLAATVILTVKDNKIARVDYCLIPPPDSCKRTGCFPGLITLDGDSSPRGSEIHRHSSVKRPN